MVVEDAVVLGTLFSHLDKWSQVGSFLNAYQELREGRTKAVKVEETTNANLVALPHGEMRDARNKNIHENANDLAHACNESNLTLREQDEEQVRKCRRCKAADISDWIAANINQNTVPSMTE